MERLREKTRVHYTLLLETDWEAMLHFPLSNISKLNRPSHYNKCITIDIRWVQCSTKFSPIGLSFNYDIAGPGPTCILVLTEILYPHWIVRDKKEEIWPSPMTKAPTPTEMSKGKVTTQTTPQKSSIKQRLRTDLGRSVGVTKATQLVWLTGLRAHLPTNRNSRVIKRTHI